MLQDDVVVVYMGNCFVVDIFVDFVVEDVVDVDEVVGSVVVDFVVEDEVDEVVVSVVVDFVVEDKIKDVEDFVVIAVDFLVVPICVYKIEVLSNKNITEYFKNLSDLNILNICNTKRNLI